MEGESVVLKRTKEEALVLFEWLANLDSEIVGSRGPSAEQKVFWEMEAQLERTLVEPLAPNYTLLLQEARRRIVGEN